MRQIAAASAYTRVVIDGAPHDIAPRSLLAPSSLAAAHSMDTTWFAVDDDGHVAQFFTGENGGIPTAARASSDAAIEAAFGATQPRQPFVQEQEEGSRFDDYVDDDNEFDPRASGWYTFSHERDFRGSAQLYQRASRPLVATHITALPEIVRAECFAMTGVRFEESPILQPLDRFAGIAWGDSPYFSLEHGDYRRWSEDRQSEVDLESFDRPRPDDAREYSVDAATELRRCFREWTIGVVPSFDPWWATHQGVARIMLTDDEIASLRHALTHMRARSLLEPVLVGIEAKVIARAPTQSRPVWITATETQCDLWRAALEAHCAQGALPLSWLDDEHRRYLCDAREWLMVGSARDLRDRNAITSTAMIPPVILQRLRDDLPRVISAESLAREERGGSVIYWRSATREAIRFALDHARERKTDRELAIESLGFALDPVLRRVAVLWVCADSVA